MREQESEPAPKSSMCEGAWPGGQNLGTEEKGDGPGWLCMTLYRAWCSERPMLCGCRLEIIHDFVFRFVL